MIYKVILILSSSLQYQKNKKANFTMFVDVKLAVNKLNH